MEASRTPSRSSPRTGWFRRFARDRAGVSAIEFTLIFPVLLALFAGTVDLGQALLVSRKMNQIVATGGDIVSQNGTWTTADATALLKGMATIIQPYDVKDLAIELIVLDVDSKLVATVNWSLNYNGNTFKKGVASPVTLPADMATANVQTILVQARFSFSTPFSSLLTPVTGMSKYTYARHYFMRPRTSNTVALN